MTAPTPPPCPVPVAALGPPVDPGRRGRLALTVAAAVDSVGGVRRTGGGGVEVSTQYPGGRVLGVRLAADAVAVHIIAERLPLEAVAEAVRFAACSALVSLGDSRAVTVAIEDLDVSSLPGGSAT